MLGKLFIFMLLAVACSYATLMAACGSIVSSDTYTMSAPLAIGLAGTCISIEANDVTLDCGGNIIDGGIFTTSTGISSNRNNTVIRNCRMTNFQKDFLFTGASHVRGENLAGGTPYGLVVDNTNDSTFENISFDDISIGGIWLDNSSNRNNFTNISINNTGTGYGINVSSGQNNSFDCVNGIINGTNTTGQVGIYDKDVNNSYANCIIRNQQFGVDLVRNSYTTLTSLNISSNGTNAHRGIRVNGNYTHINGTNATQVFYGIEIISASNYTTMQNVRMSTTTSVGAGILLTSARFSTINASVVSSTSLATTGRAIYSGTTASHNITIANSSIIWSTAGTQAGIYIDGPSTNWTIFNNTFSGTDGYVLRKFGTAASNIVFDSNTYSSLGRGIQLASLSNSTFTNNFIKISGSPTIQNGFVLSGTSTNNSFTNNIIVNLKTGASHGFEISGNEVTNNYFSNNSINLSGGTGSGFYLDTSQSSNITNNQFNLSLATVGISALSSTAGTTYIINNQFNQTGTGATVSISSTSPNWFFSSNIINSTSSGTAISVTGAGVSAEITNNSILTAGTAINVAGQENTISNNSVSSTGASSLGIQLAAGNSSIVFNNTVNMSGATAHGLRISVAKLNNVSFNVVNVTGGAGVAFNLTRSNDTLAYNNTFSSESFYTISLDDNSTNNSFYWNNLTKGSVLINDSMHDSVTNTYNTTIAGKAQGNQYADINILAIYDSDGDSWGDTGSKYPYNATNTANFTGNGSDSGPYTTRRTAYVSNLSLTPSGPTCTQNITMNFTALTYILNANPIITYNISCFKNGVFYDGCGENGTISNNTAYLYNFTLGSGFTTTGDNWSMNITVNDTIAAQASQNATTNSTVASCGGGPTLDIVSQLAFTNASVGHWFYANATVNDTLGGADIGGVNITTTTGVCVQFSNSTVGDNFGVVFNCSATTPSTSSLKITFYGSSGSSKATSTLTNGYPDPNLPTLTGVAITPSTAYTNTTLTCNPGTFSDGDADTENQSARTWRWFRNTTAIGGQTATTLAPSNFAWNDSIICEQSATNSTWTTSNVSANSSAIVIKAVVNISSDLVFTNASAGHWFYANATANSSSLNGSNISMVAITATSGSCIQFSNSTSGNNFSVVYNCSATTPSTPTITIQFNDTVAGTGAATASLTNAYPDNAPSLTRPTISPAMLFVNITATAVNGTYTDIDGDTENQSARTWNWTNASILIPGQFGQTLVLSSFAKGNNITVSQNATNSTWTPIASNTSLNYTINDSVPSPTFPIWTTINISHATLNCTAIDGDGGTDITQWNYSTNATTVYEGANGTLGMRAWFMLSYHNLTAGVNYSTVCGFTDGSAAYSGNSGENINTTSAATAPTAPTNLFPNGGENFYTSPVSITWTASTDAEGDPITYHLYYSIDSGNSYIFIATSATNSYSWDISSLPFLSTYRVRLYANDSTLVSANTSSANDFTLSQLNNGGGGGGGTIPPIIIPDIPIGPVTDTAKGLLATIDGILCQKRYGISVSSIVLVFDALILYLLGAGRKGKGSLSRLIGIFMCLLVGLYIVFYYGKCMA